MSDDGSAALFSDLVDQHGGVANLNQTQLALIRRLAIALVDDGATTSTITQLMALLPATQKVADSDAPGAIIVVPDDLSADQLRQLADGLRQWCPSSPAIVALIDENTDLKSQLFDASMAFSMRDFVRLEEALRSSYTHEHVGYVQALKSENDALRAENTSLRAGRAIPPPRQQSAPAASAAAPNRPLTPAEAPDCRPLTRPADYFGHGGSVTAPSGAERFSYGGSGM